MQRAVQRPADHRRPGQRGLDVVEHVLVPLADPDRGQVLGQAADRRLVRPAVVVHDHDQPRVLGRGDVVQRLPGHPAGQRAVADDRDHGPVRLAAQLVRLGQAVGIGQAGGSVRVLHQVVLGLGPARVAGQPAALPQRAELRDPPGQQLVHVRLVPGVEDDLVLGRVEDPVDRDRELDHAEVRPEVPAGPDRRLDQQVTDLPGQAGELILAQSLQVLGAVDALQQGHGVLLMCCTGLMGNANRTECTSSGRNSSSRHPVPDTRVVFARARRRSAGGTPGLAVTGSREHQRAAGEQAGGEFGGAQHEQQGDRDVPAAGGAVQQPDHQRPGAGDQVADRLGEGGQRGRDARIRGPRHHEEDGQAEARTLADAEDQDPERGRAERRPQPPGQPGRGPDQAGHDQGALAGAAVGQHRHEERGGEVADTHQREQVAGRDRRVPRSWKMVGSQDSAA